MSLGNSPSTWACHILLLILIVPAHGQTYVTGTIFADNYFEFYVSGELVMTDPLDFTPHQAVAVNFSRNTLGTIVYAIYAQDYGDSVTGLEYGNSTVGDGSLLLRFDDGTVSSDHWKCFTINYGPENSATCIHNSTCPQSTSSCRVSEYSVPYDWYGVDFDDSTWQSATLFTAAEAGWGSAPVCTGGTTGGTNKCQRGISHCSATPCSKYCIDPKTVDWGNASFIWQPDLKLDNKILCRYTACCSSTGCVPGGPCKESYESGASGSSSTTKIIGAYVGSGLGVGLIFGIAIYLVTKKNARDAHASSGKLPIIEMMDHFDE